MSRFIDGYVFAPPPPTGPAPTLNLLLIDLGVSFQPVDEQRTAVEGWLRTNTPVERLARAIRDRFPSSHR